jgi:hypothetical protein
VKEAVAEQVQRKHRLGDAGLDRDERGEQDQGAGALAEDRGAGPSVLVAAQQREDEQEQPAGQRDLPGPVEAAGDGVARLLHVGARDGDAEQPDREVDQEDPAPVQAARESAADERSDGERGADRRAIGGERPGALADVRIGVGQQRQRDGEHDRGADPLDRAHRVQHGDVPGRGTTERRDGEDRQAGQEQPAAAEPVGERAGDEDRGGERERVGVDDPLQARQARVEVLGDARERRVHDGDVEHEHRGGRADHHERPALGAHVGAPGKRKGTRGSLPPRPLLAIGELPGRSLAPCVATGDQGSGWA